VYVYCWNSDISFYRFVSLFCVTAWTIMFLVICCYVYWLLGTCLLRPGRFLFFFSALCSVRGQTGEPGEGVVDTQPGLPMTSSMATSGLPGLLGVLSDFGGAGPSRNNTPRLPIHLTQMHSNFKTWPRTLKICPSYYMRPNSECTNITTQQLTQNY